MAFVSDTFTDTDGTALENHTGETGATWSTHPDNSGGPLSIYSNRIEDAGSSAFWPTYYASGTPASADYDVEAVVTVQALSSANDRRVRIAGRMDTTDMSCYSIQWRQDTQEWTLHREVTGTNTILDTWAMTADEAAHDVKLEMRGTTIKGYIDGTERLSATDSDISDAGRAGILAFGLGEAEDPAVTIDDFTATDAATGTTQNVTATLAGTSTDSVGSIILNLTGTTTLAGTSTTGGAITVDDLVALTATLAGTSTLEGPITILGESQSPGSSLGFGIGIRIGV